MTSGLSDCVAIGDLLGLNFSEVEVCEGQYENVAGLVWFREVEMDDGPDDGINHDSPPESDGHSTQSRSRDHGRWPDRGSRSARPRSSTGRVWAWPRSPRPSGQ